MSEVGTSYVWVEPEEEPAHHWYEPGTFVSFVNFGGKISNPYPVLAS
jgi:hypothetical protein